jgi:heme/copper-type cytochrome/quinol oxidase subunit 2
MFSDLFRWKFIMFSEVFGFNYPANSLMYTILSLVMETYLYGFLIFGILYYILMYIYMFGESNLELVFRIGIKRKNWFRSPTSGQEIEFTSWYRNWIMRYIDRGIHLQCKYPKYFSKSQESFLDICFLVLPTTVVVMILVPTLGFLYNNDNDLDYFLSSFSIDVTGSQWYWSYLYKFDNVNFLSFDSIINLDNSDIYSLVNRPLELDMQLILPVDTYISVNISSNDVIHSWALPQLGLKVDAIPGRTSTTIINSLFVGTYYGQCSELCGVNHGFMPIAVKFVKRDTFFFWINSHYSFGADLFNCK